MKPFRIAALVLTSVAAGLLLSLTAAEPAHAEDVTITSPSIIEDVGPGGTPGALITGTISYFSGALTRNSFETATVMVGRDYPSGTQTVVPVVMDSGQTDGKLSGSWTFFVPASSLGSFAASTRGGSNSIDGPHTFVAYVLDVTKNDAGDTTYKTLAASSKQITLVPVQQTAASPTPTPDAAGTTATPSPSQATTSSTATPSAAHAPPPPGTGKPTASRLGTGNADADSVYSALTPAQDIHMTTTSAIVLVALTLILLLLIGFPGVLIESTVSKHYDELFPWVKRRREKASRVGSPAKVATWITVTLGVAVASVISGFVDPQFGLNPGSARLLLSSAIVFVVLSVIGWLIVEWVIRSTDPTLRPAIEFKWLSLLVVVFAVLLSRLTGFEPGIVFGLVVGLSFGAALNTVQSARTVLVGVAYSFILGLSSWLAYSALKPVLGASPGVGPQFTLDALAGMAVAGMSTLPVALLPITALGGAAVFKWNRWVWGLVYAACLAAFFVVLMPLPQAWGEVSLALAVWVTLYACFAVGAILFWGWFRIKDGGSATVAVRHGK